MFGLLKYAKNYRKQIILGPVFKFLEACFELVLPLFMAHLVDVGIRQNDRQTVIEMAPLDACYVVSWFIFCHDLSILCFSRFARFWDGAKKSINEEN